MVEEQDVVRLIDEIWLTTLGMATHQVDSNDAIESGDGVTLDGLINITGDYQATVALQVPRPLASKVASAMFRLGERTPRGEDMQDAIGELTNMLGGNLKAMMPGSCQLSLPAVVEGNSYSIRVPTSHSLMRVAFACNGHRAMVSLLSAPTSKAA